MKNNIRLPQIEEIVLVLLIVGGLFYLVYLWGSYNSLDSWKDHVERSEYQLLYSEENNRHWIAIFDAGNSQLAIFIRSFNKRYPPFIGSLSLNDKHGKSILSQEVKLEPLRPDGWIVSKVFSSEGCLFHLNPTYADDIFLTYAVSKGKEIKGIEKNSFALGDEDFLIFDLQIIRNKKTKQDE